VVVKMKPHSARNYSGSLDETAAFHPKEQDEGNSPQPQSTPGILSVAEASLLASPLRALSRSGVKAVATALCPRKFSDSENLLRQGSHASQLYFVQSGTVKVLLTIGQERREIDRSAAGDIVGEMSFLTGDPCTADVVANGEVEVLMLSSGDFARLKQDYPELEISLAQLASERLGSRDHDALCGKEFGGYRLKRCINRGGMGVVYEAEDADRNVFALKMLRHKFVREPEVIEKFMQEGRLLSRLRHPNIVSVHECFVAYNTRFLVMDCWPGTDLATLVRSRSDAVVDGLGEQTCIEVVKQVSQALLFAHDRDVLHLDIKPANILSSGQGEYALSDFGLSRLIGGTDGEESIVGTLPYMAPEQFRADALTPSTDLYSLACTAAELLLGRKLFPQETFSRIWASKQLPPAEYLPELRCIPELDRFIRTGLAVDPADRKVDLAELASL